MSFRAKKAGSALKAQRATEHRYDEEDALGTPDRVIDWMNVALEGEHPPLLVRTSATKSMGYKKLNFWMRDGTALCKMINKLLKHAGKPPIKYNNNANTAFVALENIENFNKGCVLYGLEETACFASIDLYEGAKGPFLNVINLLNALGFEANKQGFTPDYEAVEAPTRGAEWAET